MTALPLQPPRLLTVDEFAALPEASDGQYELQEGHIVMSPRPVPEHQVCSGELFVQLRAQAPSHLRIVQEVDVNLGLVPPARPGFVRIPDIAAVTRAGLERRHREGGLLRASDVMLAIELVSDGSERTDRTIKHGEYADAGIPHYWIIDIGDRPALTVCHQAGEFGYADAPAVTGVFTTDEPFPIRLNLDRLT